MRCERFLALLLLFAACSRETPAPPPSPSTQPPPAASTQSATPAAPQRQATYDEALDWFRTAPRFAFVIDEAGVHAEGTLTRRHVGAESIEFRANGEEWRATAAAQGIVWERRDGGTWAAASNPPAFGNRLFQRVTLVFDPAKKEGSAQLVEPNHYRFTNANTGEVHDVWVSPAGQVTRMKIGESMELKITP